MAGLKSSAQGNNRIHADIKQVPYSAEAEQSVLGALLMSDAAYSTVSAILSEQDFFLSDHRLIYKAISALSQDGKPRDVVTMSEYMGDEIEKAGGLVYLGRLVKETPTAANVKAYAEIVAEKARARRAIATMSEAISELYGSRTPDDVISEAQAKLEAVATSLIEERSFADILRKTIDVIEANRARRRLEGGIPGVSFTLKAIDGRTGGARPGQLIVVAGRPSLGKSGLVHQIALQAAMAKQPVCEISIEMSEEQLGIRSFAHRFGVNGTGLMLGYDQPIEQLSRGLAEDPGFKNIPLFIDVHTREYHAIASRITEAKRKHDIKLAIVDHVGLIRCDGFNSNNDRIGYISGNLKELAKRLSIPIILVSQFNRAMEKEKRKPGLSDLRDSGNLEQDADVCLFIHSEGDDEAKVVDVELGLLKNRDGMRGWIGERFQYNKQTQVFEQILERERHEP
jgi:replicative DNA helicase